MSAAAEAPAFRELEIDAAALTRNIHRAATGRDAAAPRVIDLGADAWGAGAALVAPIARDAGCSHALVGRVSEALSLAASGTDLRVVCADPFAAASADALAASGILLGERDAAGALVISDLPVSDAPPAVVPSAEVLGCEVFGLSEREYPVADEMEPVLTLWAPVVGLKRVGADEGVSYGYRYRTASATRLALVSLGYADGLDRAAGNLLDVRTAGGLTTRIAGRVAMDAFVIDVGNSPCAVGDRVVVWGDARRGEPSIGDAAARLGTHSAELATRLTARPRRRVIGATS